jgi:hypothetical protein
MFEALLERIAAALDSSNLPYMVIGGQAVLVYGEPRLTKDIDITLGVDTDRHEQVVAVAATVDLKPLVADVGQFVRETHVLPLIHEDSAIRVDLVFSFSRYEQEAIQRASPILVGHTSVRFASLEDIVIHKIIAGRPRDLEDVRSILLKNPRFDRAYVETWLAEFERSLEEKYLDVLRDILASIGSP